MECFTNTLKGWESAGCNIDTGIPASIIAQMIRKGEINSFGSFAPEIIVPPNLFFRKLKEKKMRVFMNNNPIN
jgi:saccharopine dehydrogenase-like NADP-dependent oxidoreductase